MNGCGGGGGEKKRGFGGEEGGKVAGGMECASMTGVQCGFSFDVDCTTGLKHYCAFSGKR